MGTLATASEADFVIVGAGSAGCVLADRLSASGRDRVLVLEAGGSERRVWTQVPIGYGRSFYDPTVNWMYRTEPDPGLAGRRGYWPRGKVLGGSSAINAMVFIRGHPSDFDAWRDAGNPGWGWSDLVPYFKRIETAPHSGDQGRGDSGPIKVSDVAHQHHSVCEAFIGAGVAMGIERNDGFNGPSMAGIGHYEITTHAGLRMSAARAYLRPAMARPNLTVATEAHATAILLDGKRATGVAFRRHGRAWKVRARREVILAAGAVNTPLLLQYSGIGPPEVLTARGIPVAHALAAVGRNLQDHLCVDYIYRSRVPTLNDELGSLAGKARACFNYALRRRGPLGLSINQAGGFVRLRSGPGAPDIQLYFTPLSYTRLPPGTRPLMQPDPFSGLHTSVQPCRPASRGYLHIRSADPDDPPVIVPNSLAEPADVEDMLAGVLFLRRLAATSPFSDVIEREMLPGPDVTSREALIEDFRNRASTVFHPVSTCRMGPDPATAVVDQALRVHGMHGLRIIDASVFPTLTSGNTNAPVLMTAEKGADLVLNAR